MKNDVTITHRDYDKNVSLWVKVQDVCDGQDAVKDKTTDYLCKPNPQDISHEANLRYQNYLNRAVFYNFTRRTLQSMIGAAFKKLPKLEIPTILDYVKNDIDGSSLSIYQQSQKVLSEVLKKGRTVLYVDYPTVDANLVSVADLQNGYIRPVVIQLNAENVTYWETKRFGASNKLSLVIIKEMAENPRDGFGYDMVDQYRVLRFDGYFYSVELWRKGKTDWQLYQEATPVFDGAGRPFNEIPLIFVGSTNNSPDIDYSPMLDIANVNLGHYENSASYESLVFFCGQVQSWIGGLSEQWRDWLQKQGITIGAGSTLLLPDNSSFNFAQAEPNTLAFEAMKAKEQAMVAMGARMVEKGSAVKTATQSQNENEAEYSVLSLCVSNLNEAYLMCLDWMLRFLNVTATINYEINQDFSDNSIDAQKITALVNLYNSGKYSEIDLWQQLRKYGLINPEKTDEDIKGELENDMGSMNE